MPHAPDTLFAQTYMQGDAVHWPWAPSAPGSASLTLPYPQLAAMLGHSAGAATDASSLMAYYGDSGGGGGTGRLSEGGTGRPHAGGASSGGLAGTTSNSDNCQFRAVPPGADNGMG